MHVSNQVKILGLLLISGLICQVAGQSATFTDKLNKVSIKPTVALSFADKKLVSSGSATVKLKSIKGKLEFVAGINNEPALVISNQEIGVTGIGISGGKICSASSGSFVCFFTPLVKYDDIAKQRHYFFSENQKDTGIYSYIMGNSRLTLQFKNMIDNKYSWPSYACDFKWRKGSTERFEPGKWYHIAISWDSKHASIFINGVLRNKKTVTHKSTTDFKNIILGTYGGKSLNGAICNVAFFAEQLSQKDIRILSFLGRDKRINNFCKIAYPGKDGKLVYKADSMGNIIPDFSWAGYMNGGVAIPDIKAKITLYSTSGKDDTARIQSAIDRIAKKALDKNGFRGAVLLKKGVYRVSGSLVINKSGIVLRGQGQGKSGTVIIATGKKKRDLIQIGEAGKKYPTLFFLKKKGRSAKITDDHVPIGATSFHVDSSKGFKAGDKIIVYCLPNDQWVAVLGMNRIPPRKDDIKQVQWKTNWHSQKYLRVIKKIDGGKITINAPVMCRLDKKYFPVREIYKYKDTKSISQVGIENLRLVSEYEKGKEKIDEMHAWTAVSIDKAVNVWVRNVTAVHFAFACVYIVRGARNVTVQDCAYLAPVSKITGGRRYSFLINGQNCLVQRCYSRSGRHAYVTSGKVRGPNVFLDCYAIENYADIGPHQRWATGTLYDNITAPDGQIYVQDRGSCGPGHGWAGANEVIWNCLAKKLICEQPPTAQNYCIGSKGKKRNGYTKYRPFGYWESHEKHVSPRSLYLKQLEDRLGSKALNNVSIAEQRRGEISKYLINKLSK